MCNKYEMPCSIISGRRLGKMGVGMFVAGLAGLVMDYRVFSDHRFVDRSTVC